MYPHPVERSLGFVAVQPRNGTVTIPAEARRALRLDLPGAQVEVILRDHDLVLVPHVAVRLEQVRRHRLYEKVLRETNTLHAHDERNEAGEGDIVRVVECRPLSRTKRWRLVEILEKAK